MFDKQEYNKRYYRKTEGRPRNKLKWENWEIWYVIQRPCSDSEISNIIQRSVKSIQCKRSRLLKLK